MREFCTGFSTILVLIFTFSACNSRRTLFDNKIIKIKETVSIVRISILRSFSAYSMFRCSCQMDNASHFLGKEQYTSAFKQHFLPEDVSRWKKNAIAIDSLVKYMNHELAVVTKTKNVKSAEFFFLRASTHI